MIEAKLTGWFGLRLAVIGLFTFGLGALFIYWVSRSYVKALDDESVTVRSGTRYAWRELKKIKPVYWRRYGISSLNHVELHFPQGTAGVYYQMFDNGAEVLDFVRRKTGQPLPFRA